MLAFLTVCGQYGFRRFLWQAKTFKIAVGDENVTVGSAFRVTCHAKEAQAAFATPSGLQAINKLPRYINLVMFVSLTGVPTI